jgi:ferredoxin-NADP reductase
MVYIAEARILNPGTEAGKKTMAEYRMTLVDRQRIASGTMAFWFEPDEGYFEFRAGQHVDLACAQPQPGCENDNFRTFSLASSPQGKKSIMIAMRMRRTIFKNALQAAALGTKFVVSRARGSFTLHKDVTRPAVFLAGGIGITPIRSILQHAAQQRLGYQLYLFYSSRTTDDAAFLDELESLGAQNHNFIFVPTVTGQRTLAWAYEKGHISHEMLKRYLVGLKGPVYYIAGPSGMVTAMTSLLNSAGVSEDDIKTEEFGDYKSYESAEQAAQPTADHHLDFRPQR